MRKNTHCMIIAACLCAAMIFSCIGVFADTGDGDASAEGSTVQQDQDTSQTGTDDQTAADGFVSVNGKVYYYKDGKKQFTGRAGVHTVNGDRYYFYRTGSVAIRPEGVGKTATGKVCVFDAPKTVDGVQVSPLADRRGMVSCGGKKYFVSRGVMVTDLIERIDGDRYYFGSSGALVRSSWIKRHGNVYRASSSGKFIMGRRARVGNYYYYFSSGSGRKIESRVFYDKSRKGRYYAGRHGVIRTKRGWVYCGGNRYRAGKNGRIVCGRFFRVNGYGYRSSSSGRVYRRTFTYKGVTFHPNRKTGALSAKMYSIGKADGTYVVIDISRQTLTFYRNGHKELVSLVVTGNGGGHTPIGIFHVNAKMRNINLTPATGGSRHVNYWMCFMGSSYGMHDAYWRSSFGGHIYLSNGSHGCVNMPYSKARALFHKVRVGTLVIIQR